MKEHGDGWSHGEWRTGARVPDVPGNSDLSLRGRMGAQSWLKEEEEGQDHRSYYFLIPNVLLLSIRQLLRPAGPSGESWHPDYKLAQSVTSGTRAPNPVPSHFLLTSCTGQAVTSSKAHS